MLRIAAAVIGMAVVACTVPVHEALFPWMPEVEKEWARYGRKLFASVPVDQPHATLVFTDECPSTCYGVVWVLIDGQRADPKRGTTTLFRVPPGGHCVRVEALFAPRLQARVGKHQRWVSARSQDEMHLFVGHDGAVRYRYAEGQVSMDDRTAANAFYDSVNEANPDAAYANCLRHVSERRSQ